MAARGRQIAVRREFVARCGKRCKRPIWPAFGTKDRSAVRFSRPLDKIRTGKDYAAKIRTGVPDEAICVTVTTVPTTVIDHALPVPTS